MTVCDQVSAMAERVRRVRGRGGVYAQQRAGWTSEECKRREDERLKNRSIHG